MTEKALREWIFDTYAVQGDCPWEDDDSTVFRHPEDRKWFALLMHIAPERLIPKAYPPAEQARIRAALPRAGPFVRAELAAAFRGAAAFLLAAAKKEWKIALSGCII